MTLADDAAELEAARTTNRLRQERDTARAQSERLADELDRLQQIVGIHESATAATPPKWLVPARAKKHHATVCTILSDCHFDEVVRPGEIGGLNAYSRAIGELRLRRWADRVVAITRDYVSGVDFDGLVVMLGGDVFSGALHDLAETNEDTLPGSVLHWSALICSALEMLADEFGRVHVPCVVGNHGRLSYKPRTKLRARDNIDWLLGHLVARHFAADKRVTVTVTDDPDAFVPVYDTVHLLTHGDQTKGGGGIGGIWPPIMRMAARKQQRYAPAGRPFDIVVMGHWHQLIMAPEQGLIVNGSLKGYDEFAAHIMNARPERAQQALWLVTPEHGVTASFPVIVADPKTEGWG